MDSVQARTARTTAGPTLAALAAISLAGCGGAALDAGAPVDAAGGSGGRGVDAAGGGGGTGSAGGAGGASGSGGSDGGVCERDGVWYRAGESFSPDPNCGVCTCAASGSFTCSLTPCSKDGGAATDTQPDAIADGDAGSDAGIDAGCDGPAPNFGCHLDCIDFPSYGQTVCRNGTWTCVLPPSCPPERCVETAWPSPVCGALCGNGARDTCSFRLGPQTSCPDRTGTEACDGDDFGAESCGSQGFGSGKLTCSTGCTIDVSSCSACVPPSPPVVRCGRPPLAAFASDMDIAASDSEVGLAWVDESAQATRVSFARLSPDLDVLASIELEGPGSAAAFPGSPGVAAATLPAGWIVGIWGEVTLGKPEVFFHAIDSQGRDVARVTLDTASSPYNSPFKPFLASRPGGGPLMVWQTSTAVRASAIAADGRSATSPSLLALGPAVSLAGAAYIGDAFYVTLLSAESLRLFVERIETDGRATSVIEALPGELTGWASLVAGAPDLRIVYSGADPLDGSFVTYFRRLAAAGDATSSAVDLGWSAGYAADHSLAVAAGGGDTIALLSDLTTRASIVRVTGADQIVVPIHDVAVAPGFSSLAMARRGTDVVVGWLSPLGLGLARIAP